jgi:hypothetical protein
MPSFVVRENLASRAGWELEARLMLEDASATSLRGVMRELPVHRAMRSAGSHASGADDGLFCQARLLIILIFS